MFCYTSYREKSLTERKKILKKRELFLRKGNTERKRILPLCMVAAASPITWDRINPPPPGSKPSTRAKIKQQRLKVFKRPKWLYTTLRKWKKKRVIHFLVVEGQTAKALLVWPEKK